MDKILNKLFQYLLISSGLIFISWMLWARFIRERTIRTIPDELFTELRFWILLYICCIYLYVIKNLIKPKKPNEFVTLIIEILYLPLTTLDHAIKYNIYIFKYYEGFMLGLYQKIKSWNTMQFKLLIYGFQIIPRIILILFLLVDTFYLHKIELFYKVVLLGIMPLFLRYFNYSIKDIYNHWIKLLENNYSFVFIFEEGYEFDISHKVNTKAVEHYKKKTIKEYIEIKTTNLFQWVTDEVEYQYIAHPFSRDSTQDEYALKVYGRTDVKMTSEDYIELKKLFYEKIEYILDFYFFIPNFDAAKEAKDIKYFKIFIFSCYVICFGYMLIVSYYHYPVEFQLAEYLIKNIIYYLLISDYGLNLEEITTSNIFLLLVIKALWLKLKLLWLKIIIYLS